MSGWISIHRKIQEHWLYKEKRKFSKFEAWLDLLMNVNHKDNKILFEGKLLEIKRGQMLTSEVKLSNKWDWSRKKTRNFLELLETDEMIVKMVIPNKGTIIEIVNYNEYQKDTTRDTTIDINNTDIQGNREQQKNNQGTTEEQPKITDNDGNSDNNNYKYKKDTSKDTSVTIDSTSARRSKEQQKIQHKNNIGTTEEQHRNTNNNDNNVNNDNKNNVCMYDENLKNIVRLLKENIGVIPPILIDEIDEYSRIFNIKMFGEATKIAAGKKSRNVPYVLGILRNWKDNNILTIDDLEALRREKEIEKQRKQQKHQYKNKQYNKPKKTRFHNFEQRSDKYTAKELDDIAERKMEQVLREMREQNQL